MVRQLEVNRKSGSLRYNDCREEDEGLTVRINGLFGKPFAGSPGVRAQSVGRLFLKWLVRSTRIPSIPTTAPFAFDPSF